MLNFYNALNIRQDTPVEDIEKIIKKAQEKAKESNKKGNYLDSLLELKYVAAGKLFLTTIKHYGSKENYDRALKKSSAKKVNVNKSFDFKKSFKIFTIGLALTGCIIIFIHSSNLVTIEIQVPAGTSIEEVLEHYGITEFELRGDGLRGPSYVLKEDGTYEVRVSKEKAENIEEIIKADEEAKKPETYAFKYIVKPGNTSSGLAAKYNLSSHPDRELYIGEELILYTYDKDIAEEMNLEYEYDTAEPFPTEYEYYEVQSGDNISKIAGKFGVTSQRIVEFNNISNIHGIQAGKNLIIVYEWLEGKEAYLARLEAEKNDTKGAIS